MTCDHVEHAKAVRKLLENADEESLNIPDVVFAEVVYVLTSLYEYEKEMMIEQLNSLINFKKFKLDRKLLRACIKFWKEENVSFVDAYLAALVRLGRNKLVYSFDRRLAKVDGVKVEEPK